MCYCTRVVWHTHTHTVCTPQAEYHAVWLLTDRCSKKTPCPDSGLAPGLSELHPELWAWVTVSALAWYVLLVLPAAGTKGGRGRPVDLVVTHTGLPPARLASSRLLLTLRCKADPYRPGGEVLHSRELVGDVGSVGVVLQTQWCFLPPFFSSALPVQGQTGCVRHSPSGSVFVCKLERCHPPSASHLRARRRNLNLADRRRTRTARSSFFFLYFSLCAATYTHISL